MGLPLLIQSTDTGATWTRVDLATQFSITAGNLNGINCNGTHCVAAGEDDSSGPAAPFLVQTVDGGATWALVSPAGAPTAGSYNGAVANLSKLWNKAKRLF
jgi:photosystem II stability/assembly factor-like uncharacterized protein